MTLEEHLANRAWLVQKLRAEIVGPEPVGRGVSLPEGSQPLRYTWAEFREPKRQNDGEELLWQDAPTKRYGAGILYPLGISEAAEQTRSSPADDQLSEILLDVDDEADEKFAKQMEKTSDRAAAAIEDDEDFAVSLANAYRSSAMAVSFIADFGVESSGFCIQLINVVRETSHVVTEAACGFYRSVSALVGDDKDSCSARKIYKRVPLLDESGNFPRAHFRTGEVLAATAPLRRKISKGDITLEIVIIARPLEVLGGDNVRLITVSVINKSAPEIQALDEKCIFQAGFRVVADCQRGWIKPYRESGLASLGSMDPLADERVNAVLYRRCQTFAVGHGCSADWTSDASGSASCVWTDVMPVYETPTTSADLMYAIGDSTLARLRVSMRKLASLDESDDGSSEIDILLSEYSTWIESLKARIAKTEFDKEFCETAAALISRCRACLERIRGGVMMLREESEQGEKVRYAFRLANHAMLIAQKRATSVVRMPYVGTDGKLAWNPPISNLDEREPSETNGYWRAFQIAFLLMSLRGIVEPDSAERETVDLIWFPTGGGKTEAYLGLTAFTILFNNIAGRPSGGSDVLMRYTLRLLTAQQFQRAALLFCALEKLRWADPKLGSKSFRIGLWVGGSSSPNTRKDAVAALKSLETDPDSENPFILLKCPWCGAKFGPTSSHAAFAKKPPKGTPSTTGLIPSVVGYQRQKLQGQGDTATVIFQCNDASCDFGAGNPFGPKPRPLPIVVIDEDILADPPNLVIGTVDKFAMLAWNPDIRSLFGIGLQGQHNGPPPCLIIQDELHLISGPLGSMVGAYEMAIERLCISSTLPDIKPKIVASTATISRANEQILHLYARTQVEIFPPPGIDSGDSFFARDSIEKDGSLSPGRLYVGVLAPAHGSLQTTEARVFASLLQNAATMKTDDAGRDPWWTLLCFFNSIRELGSAASLFVSDTRDYLRVILNRQGIKYDAIRKLFEVPELTSRIRSDQVPRELERLERSYSSVTSAAGRVDAQAIDACLASNIIEVGVDISRLSLMAIVGQPKTTSQYIQVSSRVGRDVHKPGVVVILYGPTKPRDRSHYERFRQYHQKLYAHVEPTSVTPFSAPAVERALHALIVVIVRQFGNKEGAALVADPFPLKKGTRLREIVEDMLTDRVSIVAPEERSAVLARLDARLNEWETWEPTRYGDFKEASDNAPLMHPAGSAARPAWGNKSWATMSSMRNVDSSCEAEVTQYFSQVVESSE